MFQVFIQDGKSVLAFPDGTRLVMPGKPASKGVTVLKIDKQQLSDHSYTFVCQLKSQRQEEDEGYNSRSSMDSEGEEHSASSPGGSDSVLGSPNPEPAEQHQPPDPSTPGSGPLSPAVVKSNTTTTPTSSKPPKIVIVKRDSTGKTEVSPKQLEDSKLMPSPGTNGGVSSGNRSVVLRTLLKQKPVLHVLTASGNISSGNCPTRTVVSPPEPVVCVNNTTTSSAQDSVQSGSRDEEVTEVTSSEQQQTVASSGCTEAQHIDTSDKTRTQGVASNALDVTNSLTSNEDVEAYSKDQDQEDAGEKCEPSLVETEKESCEDLTVGPECTEEKEESSRDVSQEQEQHSAEVGDSVPEPAEQGKEEIPDVTRDSEQSNEEPTTECEAAVDTTAALDHEVTQITAEMTEAAEEKTEEETAAEATAETENNNGYIIADDLPPSEKQESAESPVPLESETETEVRGVIQQGETVRITNTEETDCVSVGSPEVVCDGITSPPLTAAVQQQQPAVTSTVQLLVTSSPPKTAATSLANLTGLLQATQQAKLTTKVQPP